MALQGDSLPCPWGSGVLERHCAQAPIPVEHEEDDSGSTPTPGAQEQTPREGVCDLTVPARWEGLHVTAGWEGLEVGGECLLISFRVLGRHSLGPSWGLLREVWGK